MGKRQYIDSNMLSKIEKEMNKYATTHLFTIQIQFTPKHKNNLVTG